MFRTKWVARMLFQTESDGDTPFGIMSVQCLRRLEQQRRQQLLDLMDTTLAHYSTAIPTPLHICDALVVAATEDNIHLDCVYYLTRRYPATILGMRRHQHRPHPGTNHGRIVVHNYDRYYRKYQRRNRY